MQAIHKRQVRAWVMLTVFALVLCMGLRALTEVAGEKIRVAELSDNKKAIFSKGDVVINYGNSSEGYIMVKYKATKKKLKVQITKGDTKYQYDLNGDGEYEVFPLQMGSGSYKIQLYQQVKGTSYSALQSKSIDVKLSSKNVPFLYPNQYVNYDADSKCVAKSIELCQDLSTDKEKFDAIWNYVTTNISYHHIRAMTVKSGYLPDIDAVLDEKMGICFDYAAVMACMLRVQGIPTQLVIGDADNQYHAWNSVYLDDEWVLKDPTFEATHAKCKTYTVEKRF